LWFDYLQVSVEVQQKQGGGGSRPRIVLRVQGGGSLVSNYHKSIWKF
jgi:hypothetical protein